MAPVERAELDLGQLSGAFQSFLLPMQWVYSEAQIFVCCLRYCPRVGWMLLALEQCSCVYLPGLTSECAAFQSLIFEMPLAAS